MVTLDQAGRARRHLVLHSAPPGTEHVLEGSFVLAGRRGAGPGWRIVPDDSPHILLQVRAVPAGERLSLGVVGARSVHVDIDRTGRRWTVGLRLRPGALLTLFGVAGDELLDRSAPLRELTGGAADRLLERLAGAGTPEARRVLLEDFVAERAGPTMDAGGRRLAAVLAHAGDAGPRVSVPELARAVGLGPRGLHRLMRERVGLAPKRFLRIRRLHVALGRSLGAAPSWSRVALVSGYADQSHLVRDFQDLLGESPTAYLRRGVPTP